MLRKYKNYLLLHLIVFIYGFTAILGELISLDAAVITFYRTGIAAVSIFIITLFSKPKSPSKLNHKISFMLVGLIISGHWIAFFEAIHQSNVSITLACLSSAALFTAFLEPLFFKRKLLVHEVLLGLLIIGGLALIFTFEFTYVTGIILALIASFLGATFNTINGILIKKHDEKTISLYEMIGGGIGVLGYLFFSNKLTLSSLTPEGYDMLWVVILATICTAFAFVIGIAVMRELSPFTTTLAINLEPIYGIILALLIFGESEFMSAGFYYGSVLIFIAIFSNSLIARKRKKANSSCHSE